MARKPIRGFANFADTITYHVPKRLLQIEKASAHLRHLTRTPARPHRKGG